MPVDQPVFATRHLDTIDLRRKADWIRQDADDLARYAALLVSLPTWETEAEEAIEKALAAIHDALDKVSGVDAIIKRKREQANKVPA